MISIRNEHHRKTRRQFLALPARVRREWTRSITGVVDDEVTSSLGSFLER